MSKKDDNARGVRFASSTKQASDQANINKSGKANIDDDYANDFEPESSKIKNPVQAKGASSGQQNKQGENDSRGRAVNIEEISATN